MTRLQRYIFIAAAMAVCMVISTALWSLFPPAGCGAADLLSFERCGSRLDVGIRSGAYTGVGILVATLAAWQLLKFVYRRSGRTP